MQTLSCAAASNVWKALHPMLVKLFALLCHASRFWPYPVFAPALPTHVLAVDRTIVLPHHAWDNAFWFFAVGLTLHVGTAGKLWL